MLKYYLYKFGQILAGCFSLKAAYRIAVFLSDLKYLCSPRDRRAVQENLRVICGPDLDLRPIVRSVFRNFGKYLVEFFRMPAFTKEFIRKNAVVENQHLLDEALKQGKGVIIITAHIGNWELGGFALGRMGYPLTAIALPHKERSVNELFNQQRAEGGVTVVPASSAIRRCIRTLKENGIVALLADRDFSATGIPMLFFGKKTMIPRGAAMFAYRTGAIVLPMFLTRVAGEKFRISIEEPLDLPKDRHEMNEKEFTNRFMAQQVAVLERKIKEDPSQWLLFRRFWIDGERGPERITST
jgi:KDO2-lipid IV(A) lauroyltransferase